MNITNLKNIAIGAAAGALLGYAYYYFVGCNGGGCPLTSQWHITTIYGAFAGAIIALPGRKKGGGKNEHKKERGDK
jgi:hypothetical protein